MLEYFPNYFENKILDIDPQGDEEEGANVDLDSQRKGKCAVVKTSTRQVAITAHLLPIKF